MGITCRSWGAGVALGQLLFSALESNLLRYCLLSIPHIIPPAVPLNPLLWKNWAVSCTWVIINTGELTGDQEGQVFPKTWKDGYSEPLYLLCTYVHNMYVCTFYCTCLWCVCLSTCPSALIFWCILKGLADVSPTYFLWQEKIFL